MLAVISAAVARICTRGLIVIAGAYASTTCDFFPQIRGGCRMNSRESSIRTCQLGPNRWNQSPRAWACVSCVSEDILPASDQHLYGFEGNGNAVAPASQGLLVGSSPLVVELIGTRPGPATHTPQRRIVHILHIYTSYPCTVTTRCTRETDLCLWSLLNCGCPSAVPTIIRILKKRNLRYETELVLAVQYPNLNCT